MCMHDAFTYTHQRDEVVNVVVPRYTPHTARDILHSLVINYPHEWFGG